MALLTQAFVDLQRLHFEKLGTIIPQITIEHDAKLGPNDFQLRFDSRCLPTVQRPGKDEIWVPLPFEEIRDQFPEGRPGNGPAVTGAGAILKDTPELRQIIGESARLAFGPTDFLVFYLGTELIPRASELLTREVVEFWLSELKASFPATVSLARRLLGVETVTQRLRETMEERMPIRALPRLLTDFLA